MDKPNFVQSEGAEIAYDVEGTGPFLLLVAGGNGDSKQFDGLMSELAHHYTVIKYDRRAEGRSTGDKDADLKMDQAAHDAAAVIKAAGAGRGEPAYVFGNSAGADIALKLTEDYPLLVHGLVAHEPPVINLLPQPDARDWHKFADQVYLKYLTEGPAPALSLFARSLVDTDKDESNKELERFDQDGDEYDRFFAHEFQTFNNFIPDLDTLKRNRVQMVTAVGSDSGNTFCAQAARELARRRPCRCETMVGDHLAPMLHPETFAKQLHEVIERLPHRREQ